MTLVEINGKSGHSKVMIGESFDHLDGLTAAERVVVVTDSTVGRLYGELLKRYETVEIGIGEKTKTITTVKKIYDRLLEQGIDRTSLVVGVGGGIVTDITGFAASTYMRGVRFGFVPTTLLAQVDASLGGKNGVNFKGFKNMIGTIRQPEFCLIDFNFLGTLPREQIISGVSEIIKCGAISDEGLFSYVENNRDGILSLDFSKLKEAVSSTIRVKMKFVQEDEMESKERMKLNFGHTVGHAIEKVAKIPHGYAVSIGMVAAARLSTSRGLLSARELDRIETLLKNIGLPTEISANKEELLQAIAVDKKSAGDWINMILLSRIGNATILKIRKEELKDVLQGVCV